MKRPRIFCQTFFALLLFFSYALNSFGVAPGQQYFELRIYHIDKIQEARVDTYLKDVYLPALHRAGIEVAGVFKPVETDTASGKLIYLLIPFKTIDGYTQLPLLLAKDNIYTEAAKLFVNAAFDNPPL